LNCPINRYDIKKFLWSCGSAGRQVFKLFLFDFDYNNPQYFDFRVTNPFSKNSSLIYKLQGSVTESFSGKLIDHSNYNSFES